MRDGPPHNSSQAFLEDQEQRGAAYRAKHGLDGGSLNAPKGASPLIFTSPIELHGRSVPYREWIVPGLIPSRQVTMLGGDGGLGKSLLALQLMASTALNRAWLGQPVTQCRSLGVFCEDESEEIHRRMADITAAYDVTFADLGETCWQSRAGMDATLMIFRRDDYGKGKTTELFEQIKAAAIAFGARLLILDSLHDHFAGYENDRAHARAFIGALRNIALAINGAVLLLAHPSLSGMSSGSGTSGSTAWSNAVRSRLYLKRPKGDDDDEADSNTRVLKGMKSNHGPSGGIIEMAWQEGVFVAKTQPTGIFRKIENDRAKARFLACLDLIEAQGRYVTRPIR